MDISSRRPSGASKTIALLSDFSTSGTMITDSGTGQKAMRWGCSILRAYSSLQNPLMWLEGSHKTWSFNLNYRSTGRKCSCQIAKRMMEDKKFLRGWEAKTTRCCSTLCQGKKCIKSNRVFGCFHAHDRGNLSQLSFLTEVLWFPFSQQSMDAELAIWYKRIHGTEVSFLPSPKTFLSTSTPSPAWKVSLGINVLALPAPECLQDHQDYCKHIPYVQSILFKARLASMSVELNHGILTRWASINDVPIKREDRKIASD